MAAEYKSTSNYFNTSMNRKYLETYKPSLTRDTLSNETKIVKIEGKYDRRPDLMAYDMYGNANLWWVLAHYNREVLKDPLNDFKSGIEIVVPLTFRNPGSN
jgi:hypothetical protein